MGYAEVKFVPPLQAGIDEIDESIGCVKWWRSRLPRAETGRYGRYQEK